MTIKPGEEPGRRAAPPGARCRHDRVRLGDLAVLGRETLAWDTPVSEAIGARRGFCRCGASSP
jgi:hypothetical protein